MKYYIFGVSENTRVFFSNLVDQKPNDFLGDGDFLGFVVDANHMEEPKWFKDFPHVNPDKLKVLPFMKNMLNPHDLKRGIYIPTYDNAVREKKSLEAEQMGLDLLTFIDKRANVDSDVEIGPGSWIQMGASVQTGSKLGKGTILWGHAWIGHNSEIGDFSFVSTNSTICGGVKSKGKRLYVGVNCAIRENTLLEGDDITLGMGAMISRESLEGKVYLAGFNNVRKNNT